MLYLAFINLCYWSEAFMYTVYICLMMAIYSFKDVMSYKAQTRHKSNVFYLHILLQFKTQKIKLEKEFCIGFTQENSIKFLV